MKTNKQRKLGSQAASESRRCTAHRAESIFVSRKKTAASDIGYSFSGPLSEEEILRKLQQMQTAVRAGYRF